jgi:hypothetical protein
MPVIGFLHPASLKGNAFYVTAFRNGLKEAGFVEGQNVADGPEALIERSSFRTRIGSRVQSRLPQKSFSETFRGGCVAPD